MNSKKHKTLDETTTMAILTPNSSVKSSLTVDENQSETRDSFYFPGCRKDANCECEICIASMNATLDLMSTHRSSFTKSYAPRSPVSFNSLSADLSTSKSSSRTRVAAVSPPPESTEGVSCLEEERGKEDSRYGIFLLRTFWCLILLFGMEYGVSWMVSGVIRARLSPDSVKNLGLKSRNFESLNEGFEFLKNELKGMVGGDGYVSSCSSVRHALWKINQDALLLRSKCVLYKSINEEVSIWGWPLQTSGLLAPDYSRRSFTVITGRVREWSNGDAEYLVREADTSSWTQEKLRSSVVQLDPNTWILEYRRSFLLENPKLVSAAVELLILKLTSQFEYMKQEFWLPYAFGDRYSGGSVAVPT